MFYGICDLILESNIALPELAAVNPQGGLSDCRFELSSTRGTDRENHDWYYNWILPSGRIWLSFAKENSNYLLRFPGKADFLISESSTKVQCFAVPDLPLDTVCHLLLDQILPYVLASQGKLVLHASAVESQWGAIAFAGSTGEGKSTLSASLNRYGNPLIADDCLVLKEEDDDEIYAVPSYAGFRLWADTIAMLYSEETYKLSRVAHYTDKARLNLMTNQLPFSKKPVPLRRIYVLNRQPEKMDGSDVSIRALSSSDALTKLLSCVYCLDNRNKQWLRKQFDHFTRLPLLSRVRSISFSSDISFLPAVYDAILKDCAAS